MNGGWHIESVASVAVRLDKRAETVALMKETAVDDGGCAWMASNAPPIALPVVVVAGSATAGGF